MRCACRRSACARSSNVVDVDQPDVLLERASRCTPTIATARRRRAHRAPRQAGETMTTLDDARAHAASPTTWSSPTTTAPSRIGGVMGGATSEVVGRDDAAPARVRALRAGARAPHRQAARPAHRGVASLRARHRSQRLRRRRAPPARDGDAARRRQRRERAHRRRIRGRSRRDARAAAARAPRRSSATPVPRDEQARAARAPSGSTPSTRAPDTFASPCRPSGPI